MIALQPSIAAPVKLLIVMSYRVIDLVIDRLHAVADAGRIFGPLLWRFRVLLTGKQDTTPPSYFAGSTHHNVYVSLPDSRCPIQVSSNTSANFKLIESSDVFRQRGR
jgi:hypothetical protein